MMHDSDLHQEDRAFKERTFTVDAIAKRFELPVEFVQGIADWMKEEHENNPVSEGRLSEHCYWEYDFGDLLIEIMGEELDEIAYAVIEGLL